MIPPPPNALFDANSEYIIVGGLGGLGRCILQWMVSRGSRYLTVISRSNTLSPEATTMISELANRNVRVQLKSCDVTVGEDVTTLIRQLACCRPVKGILHAAAIIQDRLFDTLPYSQWKHGLAAKVQGTMNLHNASVGLKLPLDFFIMTSSYEAVVAMPTQAAYCAANSFQDAFSRFRKAKGLPSCAIAFGLITEIGDFGQRDITRKMVRRNHLYPTGELGFLKLLEAAFLDEPECTSTWSSFDPLAGSQITTCLEPSLLAMMAKKQDRNTAEAPRWCSDKKFSHLVRAMEDHLALENVTQVANETVPAIIAIVDDAIRAGDIQTGGKLIAEAIVKRVAALLMIPSESITASKSVANYGVDSLVAVELRSWLILLFGSKIPLLKLLDESVSIGGLGEWVAGERREKLLEK
jgi:acyl carrier protein